MSSMQPDRPEPSQPEEVGLDREDPSLMQLEPARLLANDARELLRARGFTDQQINTWAETFIAEHGDGSVDDLLHWITEQERK